METKISDLTGSVNVTVHKNYLRDDNSSYAKVRRRKAGINHVIARILKMPGALDKATLFHAAMLFKDGFIEMLKNGHAVDVFELGTFWLSSNGSIAGESPAAADIPAMSLGFTPSAEVLAQLAGVEVGEAVRESTEPVITVVEDRYTFMTDGSVTKGKPVRVAGSRLRVAGGEDTGIFLAPSDGKGGYATDRDSWLKAERIGTNDPSTLEFYLPDGTEVGETYALIVRTACGRGSRLNKTVREGVWSGTITVAA